MSKKPLIAYGENGVAADDRERGKSDPSPNVLTKESDQFPTDEWLLRVFAEWFDPCPLNPAPEVDGLSLSWPDRTYCNPPYSDPLPWVLKGIEEHKQGKRVVFLLKFDSTTKVYRALLDAGAHIIHIGERLHHGHLYASPFPSMLAVLT